MVSVETKRFHPQLLPFCCHTVIIQDYYYYIISLVQKSIEYKQNIQYIFLQRRKISESG